MKYVESAKAAVFAAFNSPFVIREFPVTEPKPGYARLKLAVSGVCGTDIHIYEGRLGIMPPKIIGHEFIGYVDAVAPEDMEEFGLSVGDAVISDIACPCGKCKLCLAGDDANCVNMGVTNGGDPEEAPYFHGGYGQYSYAPVGNLVKLPKELDPKMAAVFACPGPTAIHAFNLAKQANCDVEHMDTVVVQGLGPVGTFAVAYLASLNIKNVIAIAAGVDENRRSLAQKLGATEVYDLLADSEEEISARILALTEGLGADLVFEASGSPKAVPTGMELLRNRGVYLVPGQYSNRGGIEIQPQLITFKALRMIGASQYSLCDVESYVQFLLDNPQLHETIYSLGTFYRIEDVNTAFRDAMARKNIKTLLIP